MIYLGWTGDGCDIPDCGFGACYINESRGYCDGSSGAPICVCNTNNVSLILFYTNSDVFLFIIIILR